jgi:hypothetical protein
MAYPTYLREKARTLRAERRLSLDEIARCLALPKTTVGSAARQQPHETQVPRGSRHRVQLRQAGVRPSCTPPEPPGLCLPVYRRGYKRNRNVAAIGNSGAKVMVLVTRWIRRFSRNPVRFALQYHADQDLKELTEFWGEVVSVDPAEIALQRKSNSTSCGSGPGAQPTASSRSAPATRWYAHGFKRGWIACRSNG